MSSLVLPLARVGAGHRALVGGKAVHLGEMLGAGLPVPPGFCVSTECWRLFLEHAHAEALLQELEAAGAQPPEGLLAVGARLRAHLVSMPIPQDIQQAVLEAWRQLGPGLPWAVRSSATTEDLATASFAGQQDTFLNVLGSDALLEALRACWASLFSDRALLYRARQRIPHHGASMAVVVQQLIPAERSGVFFTADPVSGRTDTLVLEGCFGLGEALVSGRVSPDRMRLERASLRVLEHHTAHKALCVVPAPSGGTHEQSLSQERQDSSCLDEPFARELAALALRAEKAFGSPQDLEWATCEGRLFLLQSRPITTLERASAARPPIVWSNVNTGEVLPGVATPMTWDVTWRLVRSLFEPFTSRLGVELDSEPVFGLVAGRVYANLSAFARLVRLMPGPGLDLEEVFGGAQVHMAEVLPSLKPPPAPLARRLAVLARMPGLLLWMLSQGGVRQAEAYISKVRREQDVLAAASPADWSDEALREVVVEGTEKSLHISEGTVTMMVAMSLINLFFQVCRRWLGDTTGAVANRLLSRAGGMASAEAAMDLWRLAAWARRHPHVAEVLARAEGFEVARERLQGTEEGRGLLEEWASFVARHGHHTQGELDVARPRWSESPDEVLRQVKSYLAGMEQVDPIATQARRDEERARLLQESLQRLPWLARRPFSWLLRRAQQGLALRENLKSEAVRGLTFVRRALLELGVRLVRRGVLGEREDVFFLHVEELGPVLGGAAGFDVAERVAARRREHARNLELTPPPVVVGEYVPERHGAAPVPEGAEVLRGLGVSPGVVTGPARVIREVGSGEQVLPGEILVAPFTDPGWTPHFLTAGGIVMDMGGLLSHGSIVAREYGIPAVVNVGPATRMLRTGQLLRVDGDKGEVTVLSEEQEAPSAMSL